MLHPPQALDRLENIVVGLAKSKKELIDITVNEDTVGLNMFLVYCVLSQIPPACRPLLEKEIDGIDDIQLELAEYVKKRQKEETTTSPPSGDPSTLWSPHKVTTTPPQALDPRTPFNLGHGTTTRPGARNGSFIGQTTEGILTEDIFGVVGSSLKTTLSPASALNPLAPWNLGPLGGPKGAETTAPPSALDPLVPWNLGPLVGTQGSSTSASPGGRNKTTTESFQHEDIFGVAGKGYQGYTPTTTETDGVDIEDIFGGSQQRLTTIPEGVEIDDIFDMKGTKKKTTARPIKDIILGEVDVEDIFGGLGQTELKISSTPSQLLESSQWTTSKAADIIILPSTKSPPLDCDSEK